MDDMNQVGGAVHDLASPAIMSARLAREVRRRRSEMGLSQAALVRRGGISLATLSAIERGKPRTFVVTTLAALDRALGWEVGRSQQILDDELAEAQRAESGSEDIGIEAMSMLAEYRAVLEQMRQEPSWARELVRLVDQLGPEDRAMLLTFARRLGRNGV